MEIWLDKYRPGKVSEMIGQAKAVREATEFMDSWSPGQAAFLHGPPGAGKTLLVEALARERGLGLLRLNASDSRTAAGIEAMLGSASKTRDLFGKGRLILIDEVDGISGQERGAVGAIVKIIRESAFPVFAIANDPWRPKLAPLRSVCRVIKLSRVMTPSIEKRLREISNSEGIAADESALKSLARFAQGDLRSAISDLQVVAQGKKVLKTKDLEALGYRERGINIFSALPVIFHSRRVAATRKAMFELDRDPDEVLLWIESNIHQEFVPEKLAEAYELLSRADIMRSRVHMQQNWRFKAFMTDLMSGISVLKGETHRPPGFRPYQQPTRILMLGRSRARRAMMDSLASKIGGFTHSSRRVARRDYIPYLRIALSGSARREPGQGLELDDDEIGLIGKSGQAAGNP
jgi:replication factor C large subunit